MIDLHSHILPGVDDGAHDLAASLDMARMAVADGIQVMACTPHFMPGMYDNESNDIRKRVASLQNSLRDANIDLSLVVGCDAHIRPDFLQGVAERCCAAAQTAHSGCHSAAEFFHRAGS